MSFTTLKFILFFLLVLVGYYRLPARGQKLWLLAASYAFYLMASGSFALLLAAGTVISYVIARLMERYPARRRLLLAAGVVYTLGVLFVFKYFNFFCSSVLALAGVTADPILTLLLPVGISFFSFAISGYLFDVSAGRIPATRNLWDYAVFVAFFPTLLSGPIGRAPQFLPQLRAPIPYNSRMVRHGAMRFVWGAFKKLVVADGLGQLVDIAYADPSAVSGGYMLLAAVLYSFQLYYDFSAYSDMAIGGAEMLGLRVMENFKAPYLVRTVKDFWKKWHISLTSWFRDYLYFPLGGSRKGKARTNLNVLIVFTVSGLWHGAAYTFLIWGLLNGIYQVLGSLTMPSRLRLHRRLNLREDSRLLAAVQCIVTFLLVTAAWIFFRADTLEQAVYVCKHILLIARDGFGFDPAAVWAQHRTIFQLILCALPCIWEDTRIARGKAMPDLSGTSFRYWGVMLVLVQLIALFGIYGAGFDPREFAYFQF